MMTYYTRKKGREAQGKLFLMKTLRGGVEIISRAPKILRDVLEVHYEYKG
jgi:hypothetical protein